MTSIIDQQIQIVSLMISENSNFTYDDSFFQCYICMLTVKRPRMCPACSKLACQSCLRKWIQDTKSQCPHCRKPLSLSSFADCQRFVNDVKHLINNVDHCQKNKQKCKQHKIQMQYYCQDCAEAICSDCGMFGSKHKSHKITHLNKIYQQYKNKILNQLARFDHKIELYRKNGFYIKVEMQKLMIQIGQKKNFIQQYFLGLMERLEEQYKDKKIKLQSQFDENSQQIQLLEAFRDQICNEMDARSEKEVITNSQQLVNQIHKLCEKDKMKQFEEEEYAFTTMEQIVPKYEHFKYLMPSYLLSHQGITYSQPFTVNGIEWKLKLYPRGNGVAKDTHISVFLQMSKAYSNENKYQYKIQLVNHYNPKDSIVREYSSKFDIGQCWGYNQFIPLADLQNGFLDTNSALHFNVNVRNPTYKSLVRDQENYIKVLQNKLKSNEEPNVIHKQKISKLSKEASLIRQQVDKILVSESSIDKKTQLKNEKQLLQQMQMLEIDGTQQEAINFDY